MRFLPLVQSTHDLSWDLHSVSVGLVVRVRTYGPLIKSSNRSASCELACEVGQRWWLFVDTLFFLATFGYYLACLLASVYLLVSQKETNFWPSICATIQIKKKEYTNKNHHFVVCIHVLGQRKGFDMAPIWFHTICFLMTFSHSWESYLTHSIYIVIKTSATR
jgi:hypothetical protein